MRAKCLLDEGVRQRRVSKKGDEELGVFPSLVYEVSRSSTGHIQRRRHHGPSSSIVHTVRYPTILLKQF
jgi:hypothetical protein